jgi:hypothetical protein
MPGRQVWLSLPPTEVARLVSRALTNADGTVLIWFVDDNLPAKRIQPGESIHIQVTQP